MAETPNSAPATHKQPSRKGKKAWRKNVDVDQLQQGLADARDEVISGGIISEKAADDLFSVDVAGDENVARKQKSQKQLKADEIVAIRSAVPGLEGRKRKAAGPVIGEDSRKKSKDKNYISNYELQKLRKAADATTGVAVMEAPVEHDPWAAPGPSKHAELDFLDERDLHQKPKVEPKSLRKAPVSLAANGKPIPAVRKPEGGKSYNPLVGEWSELLEREGAAAVKAEKARLLAEAAEEAKQERLEAEARKVEAAEREEVATDYESEWEGIQSENEAQNYSLKQKRRKTQPERNKMKARKEREARERWEQKQVEKAAQLARIKEIAQEMSERDRGKKTLAKKAAHHSSDESDDGEEKLARRRFGKVQMPTAPLEVQLPDELEDSLRRLKPQGNLLTDRYRNMLLNGKVEVRKRLGQQKQPKTERYEKWSYKDWKLK
jgi:nucleolar protein 53